MSNRYDPYGFKKLYLPNIQLTVEDKNTFRTAEKRINLYKDYFLSLHSKIKVTYAFGDIPRDSIFENVGMDLGFFCDFMTKKEIQSLTKEDFVFDIEELQKQLCEQYDKVRNLVISDMVSNSLDKIMLKKFNNNGKILYTTNFMTKSKQEENVEKSYILFSKNTDAIHDYFNSIISRSLYEDYIDENFVSVTEQAQGRISSLENSKAKKKIITFNANHLKEE